MYLKQKGLGLPVAIFVVTIMSIIAVAINRINEASSQSYSQNVLSSRAFYAAESGAQLKAQSVLVTTPCDCGSTDVVYDYAVEGLSQCSAETICTSFIANGETYCTVKSIGSCDSSNAQRTIEVRLK
jgi:MSHA biogenesis protein MshP